MIPDNDAAYIHGEYGKMYDNPDNDFYVAVYKSLSTGQSEIRIIDRPEVPVYVAKPQYRINTVKRESAPKSELDMYRTRINMMAQTLYNAINNPGRWRTPVQRPNLRNLLSNPYVYGADIDYGVHLRMAANKANGRRMPDKYVTGCLDIETDVTGTHEIILITYINCDGNAYIGILQKFFQHHTLDEVIKLWGAKYDEQGNPVHWSKEDLDRYDALVKSGKKMSQRRVELDFHYKLNKKGREVYEASPPIKLHMKIFDRELDLIKWIFDCIHYHKPDFCTIWNMDYDIPYILDRIVFRGGDPADIICHPDVPPQYRICKYHKDPGKKDDHITDKWSWFHLTDYTRYIDAMCCYGRLRKAKPREPSYRLDAIGGKEIGSGKLQFDAGLGHAEMQRFHQVEYTVYNIIDVLIMHVMEMKNKDILNMMMLIGVSTLDVFSHQSLQLKNSFYEYLDTKDRVPSSIGQPINDEWDGWIQNKGGAVLSPDNAVAISVAALQESDEKRNAARFVLDMDVSLTTSATSSSNASRRTLLIAGTLLEPSVRAA